MKYAIETITRDEEQDSGRDPGHDVEHTLRVYNVGVFLGLKENANMEILEPALLLHDIVRPNDPEQEKIHAQLSAERSKEILPKFGYSSEEIDKIIHAIRAHSRTDLAEEPQSLEAKIVYDADKQDGLGYAGIDRARKLCEKRGYSLEQTAEWYLGRIIDVVKNKPLYTQKGKAIANSKLKLSLEFCREHLGKRYEELLMEMLGTLEVKF